ncbi:fimbrial biogenesis outer membrane usher protein [Cupriavidus basilensis]|uniref:Fimbrial biogenesis outer membrane usher protein n=1 Tax=Cupriavidus basilensis TaxID=68895 RepID=A0ABT6B2Q9_9BURK|nr:fimbria/pilus outer membrane usher protein [Cupriavidus basilensis]MDF3839159.1 fimbrial biogenesis outer membrane usher protein [Cupriavidus basilensis]
MQPVEVARAGTCKHSGFAIMYKPSHRRSFPSDLCPISAVVLMLFAGASAHAATQEIEDTLVAEVQFNDAFLQPGSGGKIDISRFSKGNIAAPGQYRAGLFVNEIWLGRTEVTMRQIGNDKANVQPCVDRAQLERMGVDLTKLSPQALEKLGSGECVTMPQLVPDATASYDNGELRLDVSVPQAYMMRNARGYVESKFWDEGVNAAKLQYNANVYHSDNLGQSYTQSYAGITAGVNVGPWRLTHMGSYTHSDATGSQYQAMQTNVKRAIAPINSQLTLGDGFTDGTLFDSVGYRGVQIASDDRMYPESLRGYAPTVRGIASTNARVQIRQNGNIIYETTVQPGAFEINDLYATGYGGDLEVTVTEANGSVHVSKVPYAAAVTSLRPGVTRYSMTAGQYRSTGAHIRPFMFQGTVQHGFSNMVTGYGGAVLSENYVAAMGGASLNTNWGAIGLDVTQARTQLQNQADRSGQSYRLTYSKMVAPTSTNLTLAAYRYSTSGYLGLSNAMALRDLDERAIPQGMTGIQRGRLQVTMNQALPQGWGNFYLMGSTQDYWNRSGRDTQFSVGYSNYYKRISYGVTAAREFNLNENKWVNRVMLTVGIPLGKTARAPISVTSVQHDSNGTLSLRESVSGALGDDSSLTYGLNASRISGRGNSNNTSAGANVAYTTPFTMLNGSVSKGNNYTQASAGLSGGIVAYAGGVAFSPVMGETMVIVEAKDAGGARLANGAGLRVDPWGHAVVANVIPFSRNMIEIDPKGLASGIEFKSTTQYVAPTAGAVSVVKFDTEDKGPQIVIRSKRADGKPLPFGATVLDASGKEVGVVAQGSKILASLKENNGELIVKWGDGPASSCRLAYHLDLSRAPKGETSTVDGLPCTPQGIGTAMGEPQRTRPVL